MNHRHHLLLLLLWVSVFIFSTHFPSSVSSQSDRSYLNCTENFSCGVVKNVSYPFWGGNRGYYCGLPSFHVTCEYNVTKLMVNSVIYRILEFNLTNQSLTVAREDYWGTICPIEMKNNSFSGSNFSYVSSGLQNLELLHDCKSGFSPGSQFVGSNCQNGSSEKVYYGNESSSSSNGGDYCNVTVMPVFELYARELFNNETSLLDAIMAGFGLQWSVNNGQCDSCLNSGGQCGYLQYVFTCFCPDGSSGTTCSGSSKHRKLIIAVGASAGIIGIFIVIILIVIIYNRNGYFRFENMKNFNSQIESIMGVTSGTLAPRRYTYAEVKRMTKSFTTKIGEGGYGIVYKATTPDNRVVAVKVIRDSKATGEEFINEVTTISTTSHVNIVSFLGFCYEKNKRALIYEFMPNGSLDKFIFKQDSSATICKLEWLNMYQIAIGIARGLDYLHRGCNTRILHLDIKPQNILLDEEFCPKISDFGLAKICQKKESIVSILGTRGTIGYIAPEVFSRLYGGVSNKSDVYSYGMLVLEMIGARKDLEGEGESNSSEMSFPNWIYKNFEQSNVNNVREDMSMNEEENEVVRKMTLVSLWCIQTNPADRPSMNKVVEMLEGSIQSLPFPPKPFVYSPPRLPLEFSDEPSSSTFDSNSRSNQT